MTTLPRDNGYGCGIRVTEERERNRGERGARRRIAEAESEAETGGAPGTDHRYRHGYETGFYQIISCHTDDDAAQPS